MTFTLEEEQSYVKWWTEKVAGYFAKVMSDRNIVYWKKPTTRDCLVWLQWSRILGVRVEDVISVVTDHYRNVLRKTGNSLGVNIATLSGNAAWAKVQEQFNHQGNSSLPEPRYHLRRRYESLAEYQKIMYRKRILAARQRSKGRAYRGSTHWTRPARRVTEDIILRAFGYTGEER